MRLILFLVLLNQSFFGAEAIAKILAIEGEANAVSENVERALENNSSIFALETIRVGLNSRLQILFTDGGLMNLLPDTEFRVDAYKYKQLIQRDKFSSELLKGGFRLLSGSIAKKNPNEYKIRTPSGTIGLLGTVIEARLVGTNLFVGVQNGRAQVSNEAGSAIIGMGEANQFVTMAGNNATPALTSTRPQALNLNVFVEPQGGLSIDEVQAQQQSAKAAAVPQPGGAPTGAQQTGAQPTSGQPAGAESTSTEATGAAAETGTIEETPSEGDLNYTPMGGGASIQGGC